MSFIILSLFFYFRLIMKRSTYSLEILKHNADFKYVLICSFFIALHLFLIFFVIIQLLSRNKKVETRLLLKIRTFSNFVIYKPLDYAITKLSPSIPYSGTLIIKYCYFFRKNNFRLFLCKLLCFCVYFLPRIFMALLFVIEVVSYNQVKLFIMLIIVLVVPYIYLIFLNISEKFHSNNITAIDNALVVTPLGSPNIHGVFLKHKFQIKENSGYTEKDLPEFLDAWDVLFYILNLNAIIRNFIAKTTSYITIITSSCYFTAFSYQLYYVLT